MVEDDQIKTEVGHGVMDFIGFAGADKKRGIRPGATPGNAGDRLDTSRFCQKGKLLETGKEVPLAKINTDERGSHQTNSGR